MHISLDFLDLRYFRRYLLPLFILLFAIVSITTKKEARKKEVKKECILELFQDKLTNNDEKDDLSKSSLQ